MIRNGQSMSDLSANWTNNFFKENENFEQRKIQKNDFTPTG